MLLSRKSGSLKLLLGILTAIAAVAAMVCFVLMQRASGGPDAGKALLQLYLPCALYLLIALWGAATAAMLHGKRKKERAARRALKESKKRKAASDDEA